MRKARSVIFFAVWALLIGLTPQARAEYSPAVERLAQSVTAFTNRIALVGSTDMIFSSNTISSVAVGAASTDGEEQTERRKGMSWNVWTTQWGPFTSWQLVIMGILWLMYWGGYLLEFAKAYVTDSKVERCGIYRWRRAFSAREPMALAIAAISAGGCFVAVLAWPIILLASITYGILRLLRFMVRAKKHLGKLGDVAHRHPKSVKHTAADVPGLEL